LKTAQYVRESVLALCGLRQEHIHVLMSSPYDQPRGEMQVVRYLWGKLIGDVENPAADGQAYPIMQWTSSMTSFSRSDEGFYSHETRDHISPIIAKGLQFQLERLESWDRSTIGDEVFWGVRVDSRSGS
jgi:hypothetical protein